MSMGYPLIGRTIGVIYPRYGCYGYGLTVAGSDRANMYYEWRMMLNR